MLNKKNATISKVVTMRESVFRAAVRLCAVAVGCVVLAGCNAVRVVDTVTVATQGSTITYDAWRTVISGIERRDLDVSRVGDRAMHIVRLDPHRVTFRVHYRPGTPLMLPGWVEALPTAAVIVNAAFFDDTDHVVGLLVSDGQAYGTSFVDFGGMFQVDAAGVRVRSLVAEPYQGEALTQAVQAFPMLIEVDGVLARQDAGFERPSFRTWIGQDRAGRIVIGVTHQMISLADLQTWLIDSDLDLHIAFALDGGRSTGLLVNVPGHDEMYPAFDRLPSVIAIYPL